MDQAAKDKRLHIFLLFSLMLIFVWLFVGFFDFLAWFFDTLPVVVGIAVLILVYRKFQLTNLVYILIWLHAIVGFIVRDEWQQKGMGTFLLDYITQIAKKRGARRFYAKVLPANKAMLAIFHNSGYKVNTEFDGGVYSVTYDLTK